MTEVARPARGARLRTIVLVALAAAVVLGPARSGLGPASRSNRDLSELYRRGGNTFMRLFYLARTGRPPGPTGQRFVEQALRSYQLGYAADPSHRPVVVSLALTLDIVQQKEGAQHLLFSAMQDEKGAAREALRATHLLVMLDQPQAEWIEAARPALEGVVPAPLLLTKAYERIGRFDLADGERRAAERAGQSLIPALAAMVAACGLIVGVGVIGLGFAVAAFLRRRLSRTGKAAERPAPAQWSVRTAVEGLVIWLLLQVGIGFLLGRLLPGSPYQGTLLLASVTVLAGTGALLWIRVVSPRGAEFGWRRGGWRQFGVGAAAAGLAVVPLLALSYWLQNVFGSGPAENPVIPWLIQAPDWPSKASMVVLACVIAPALEETLFRGVLYRALRLRWSVFPAALVSAVVFAAGHVNRVDLLPLMLLGIMFAYLYERGGSLVIPAVAHGVFNGFNLIILMVLFG